MANLARYARLPSAQVLLAWPRVVVLGAVAVGLWLCASHDLAAEQVANLAGKFEVSAVGSATYGMPIAVPPGTAGLNPALSFHYDGRQGDGMLGVGWSISGLPQIDRCGRTIAQDGVHGGINYDANDRFCMGGKRLVAISGSYGGDGSEYRTEVDEFSRVISHGSAGAGPAWFEVRTKQGRIMEFGNTPDSRILVVGRATARAWAVNKISDASSNYLTVAYTQDTANGQAYPARVSYTGNSAAATVPYNSVRFTYVAKPVAPTLYQAGAPIRTVQLLSSVQTFVGDAALETYQLSYQQSTATNRSRLLSVRMCGNDGACFPATTFTWTDDQNSVTPQTNMAGDDGAYIDSKTSYDPRWAPPVTADFNGDGKTDVLWYYSNPFSHTAGSVSLWLSGAGGAMTVQDNIMSAPTVLVPVGSCFNWMPYVGDFNGDGKADILWDLEGFPTASTSPSSCGARQLWISQGDGTFSIQTNVGGLDGLYSEGASFKSNPSLCQQGYPNNPVVNVPTGWMPRLADFNGDGRTDILWDQQTCKGHSHARQMWLNNGGGSFTVVANLAGLDGQYGAVGCTACTAYLEWGWSQQIADLDGDGKADIFWDYEDPYGRSFGYRKAWMSNGDGTFRVIDNLGGLDGTWQSCYDPSLNLNCPYYTPGWVPRISAATDFNGDGKADIFWDLEASCCSSQGSRAVWLSKGDGTFSILSNLAGLDGSYTVGKVWPSPNLSYPIGWAAQFADINGDGKADIIWSNGVLATAGSGATIGNVYAPGQTLGIAGQSIGQRTVWMSNGDGSFSIITNYGGLDGSYSATYGGVPPPQAPVGLLWTGWVPSVSPLTDFNGDGKADIFWNTTYATKTTTYPAGSRASWLTDGIAPDLLATITTGTGAKSTISYDSISHGIVYTRDNSATYPQADTMTPLYVVSRFDAPAPVTVNGTAAVYSTTYHYVGGKVDESGRGFLGFRQVAATDLQTNLVETTSYRQDFPFIGEVASKTLSLGTASINQTSQSYQFLNNGGTSVVGTPSTASAPYVATLQGSSVSGIDLDGSPLPTVTRSYSYDAFGSPTQVTMSTSDGFSKTTANTYSNDNIHWFIGRLTASSVTSVAPGPAPPR